MSYANRTYDTTIEKFVVWSTTAAPDENGNDYPGPGEFGVDTEGYSVLFVPEDPVLWQWNGKDTDQFALSNPSLPAPAETAGWMNPSLTYVADDTFPGGGYLDMRADTGTLSAKSIWWIDQEIIYQPMVIEFDIQFDTVSFPPQVGDIFFGGVVFAGDAGTPPYGISFAYGWSDPDVRIVAIRFGDGAGILPVSEILDPFFAYYARVRLVINGVRGDSTTYPPNGRPQLIVQPTLTSLQASQSSVTSDLGPGWLPYETGWGASAQNRIGLTLFTTSGAATGPCMVRILAIKVLKNP